MCNHIDFDSYLQTQNVPFECHGLILSPQDTKDTWDYNIKTGMELNKQYPFECGIWYPNGM
jgi:hypothetical protein